MTDQEPFVSIIILNYKGCHYVERNLPSVLDQTYRNYEVLIVDNNSEDQIESVVKKFSETKVPLRLLNTGANLGYAGGNNVGIEKILSEGRSEYIVLLNNDVRVENFWLKELIGGFDAENVGICTSKILFYYPFITVNITPISSKVVLNGINISGLNYHPIILSGKKKNFIDFPITLKAEQTYKIAVPYDPENRGALNIDFEGSSLNLAVDGYSPVKFDKKGSLKNPCDGTYIIQNAGSILDNKLLIFRDRLMFEFDHAMPNKIADAGCGAAMAIKSSLLKTLGGFKNRYFMYYEDTEISFRFGKAGSVSRFINNAICYHYLWGSSPRRESPIQIYCGVRNRLWFIRSYFGVLRFTFFYILGFVKIAVLVLTKYLGRKNVKVCIASRLMALKDALKSSD